MVDIPPAMGTWWYNHAIAMGTVGCAHARVHMVHAAVAAILLVIDSLLCRISTCCLAMADQGLSQWEKMLHM